MSKNEKEMREKFAKLIAAGIVSVLYISEINRAVFKDRPLR